MTLTPGQKHEVELPQAATLNIGMASLGEKLADKAGRSVVMVTRDTGEAYALCVLRAGATESVPIEVMIGTEDALSLSVVGCANEVHLTGNVEVQLDDDENSNSDDMDGMDEEMLRNMVGGGSDGDDGSDESDSNDEGLPLIKQQAVVEELEAPGGGQEPTVIDADADAAPGKKGAANGNASNGPPSKRAKKGKGCAVGCAASPGCAVAPAAPTAAKATPPAKGNAKSTPAKQTPKAKAKGNAGATPAKAGAPAKGAAKGTPAAAKPAPAGAAAKTEPAKTAAKAEPAKAAAATPSASGKKRRRGGKKEAASPAV